MLPQLHINCRYFRKSRHSYSNMAGASRKAVIDFEFLRGWQDETAVKELCVASATASETFRVKSPYKMANHGSSENGINCAAGHIEHKDLNTVVTEAVAGLLTSTPTASIKSLSSIPSRDVRLITYRMSIVQPLIHSIINTVVPCQASNSQNFLAQPKRLTFYDWLIHYLQTKDYVQCPSDNTRHTVSFFAALQDGRVYLAALSICNGY